MKPALPPAAEYVAVASLRPWAKNPRKNDPAVKAVADSIKRFGFGAPLIARREDGEIIAGHTRLKAAITLGLTEVPVRYLDLSEPEALVLTGFPPDYILPGAFKDRWARVGNSVAPPMSRAIGQMLARIHA